MIKSLIFWGKCNKCQKEFYFPSDPGDYEFRLLRSRKERITALIYFDDPFYKEVWNFVKNDLKNKNISEDDMIDKFDSIFGKLCDKAPDGSLYDMAGKIRCPNCNESEISYGPVEPPKYTQIDPLTITHTEWDKFSEKEKIEKVKQSLLELKEEHLSK
jgi:hypothetical protein